VFDMPNAGRSVDRLDHKVPVNCVNIFRTIREPKSQIEPSGFGLRGYAGLLARGGGSSVCGRGLGDHYALLWLETLEGTGVEGIVAKPLPSSYKAGRVWAKVRHADTVDATVVGFTGTVRHPKALAVRLPDGRVALSQRLTTALPSVIGPRLTPQAKAGVHEGRRLLHARRLQRGGGS
jgi:hypothetical protein